VPQSTQVERIDQPGFSVTSAVETTTGTSTLSWFRENYCDGCRA